MAGSDILPKVTAPKNPLKVKQSVLPDQCKPRFQAVEELISADYAEDLRIVRVAALPVLFLTQKIALTVRRT